ncbi:hypothetical protein [Nocardioides humi]|uniref:Uncharacterized protein n=1 Tax=Nocardioides humi TaxID=449461 RepID=A0ABN2AIY2_9ACTN|nr:hypothetical protein [Nocardioides humi]
MSHTPAVRPRRLAAALAVALTTAALTPALAAPAGAAAPVKSKVTIKAAGVDLFGKVKSKRTKCKVGRTVLVFKVLDDGNHLFSTDTTDERGRWDTGNTGQEGTFFAKVRKTPTCKAAKSPRIEAVRND